MPDVKAEVKLEIKPDPDSIAAQVDQDADQYEDDLDTYVPPKDDPGQAWLVRLPVDMWQAWHSIYQDAKEDEYVQIGTMRVYDNSQKIQMMLDPQLEQHKSISREYNLDVKSHSYKNSVAFSEKDKPGQRARPASKPAVGAKPYGVQSKFDRYGPKKSGGYRSSIPKQTALAPPIANEASAIAVNNLDDFAKAYQAALKPRNTTVYENSINRELHPGRNVAAAFTFSSKPGKTNKKKKEQKDKAVRMEKGALFDAISKCFEQFKYWSLKALRKKLEQPEAYIKEALDEVAVLIRSGDFAMNYKLKPEYEKSQIASQNAVKDEIAPSVKSEDESDQATGDDLGSDDDEAMDFEDVKMENNG
jgi:transcription initiation factor TFIIF subunit beta